MPEKNKLEVWLRGPLADVPPLLQPVAHALLQAEEEVIELMTDFGNENLWKRPADVASVGFHLQHLTVYSTACLRMHEANRFRIFSFNI